MSPTDKQAHDKRVAAVQAQVCDFYAHKQKVRIYHGSTNSTRPLPSAANYVDASQLDHVLYVDIDGGYALVEPNVPLDKLVDATLLHGLVPPMVAEFPGITVGGAVQGGSGESSSFKWGGFNATCLEFEIVLGNGEIVTASRARNSDLFWGMSCAFGSLGIMTLLKIKLVPATKFVHLRYRRVDSHRQAIEAIKTDSRKTFDFVDGVMFSPARGTIMSGRYTNESKLPQARFGRAVDEWFYLHAQGLTDKYEAYEEIIPLRDYLFRYDRGAFWVAKYGFDGVMPFNRLTRFLFAWLFKTRTLYRLVLASNYAYRTLVQDICLPQENAERFLDFAEEAYGIYPLWLCPLKVADKDALAPNSLNTKLVINVGIWGPLPPTSKSFKQRNRELEKKVRELGGRKVLYAHAYYTEKEFWQIYDKRHYDALRRKYHAVITFPDIYQKTATPPPAFEPSRRRGLKGLFGSPHKQPASR